MSATADLAAQLLPQLGFADWSVQIVAHSGQAVPQYLGRAFLTAKTFQFSAWLDHQPEWVRGEIIAHEAAHALLGHGYHDDGWRAAARRFGCVLEDRWTDGPVY